MVLCFQPQPGVPSGSGAITRRGLTHIGEGVDARVPRHRFFLVRLSAANTLGADIIVPNLTLESRMTAGRRIPN